MSLIHYYVLSDTPYIKVVSLNVTSNGVIIRLAVVNNGNLTFRPSGGWVEVVETGQYGNITLMNGSLVVELPLTPQWVGLSNAGIKGLVRGYLNGNPAYIAFFDVAPVHVVNRVYIIGFNYSNCVITIELGINTVVPVIINSVTNMSLFTHTNPGYYLFNDIGSTIINTYVTAGDHIINLTIPIKPSSNTYVYACSLNEMLSSGYVLYMPMKITYIYPGKNVTINQLMVKVIQPGG
ncbi:hypothetical protein [Vulcanisaeta sp. JCM 16161]|uniref:hypothetical protein n=1 Tax=Vulcanisaeta sp. JCM 16161 TaxID=1295372 RepID=UPI0006D1B90E